MNDKLNFCTKHGSTYVTECHLCYREKTQCEHGMPFDSVCDECEKQSKLYGMTSDLENINSQENIDTSHNNGGKTDYYQLESAPFQIKDFDDFAEWRGMNGNQFNIGKVAWTFNVGRHSGTDYKRDLNKIIHYAQRELMRVERENV